MSGRDNSKRQLRIGLGMLIAFVVVLFMVFMPIFGGKNGLDYMDNLYNAISKASAYYIPGLKEEGKAFDGQKIEATLSLKDKDEAAHAALLFSAAGAESLADGSDLKITGDLGAILAAGLQDADDMFHNKGKALVVEVGGGSTVLNLLSGGKITASQSLPTGSVRMQEVLETTTERADQASRLIQNQITSAVSAFRSLLPLKSVETFIAVGGDARWAASLVGKPLKSDHLEAVSAKALGKLLDRCRVQTADELARAYKIPYTDAETITPALLVYQVLLQTTRAKRMIVADVSMRDGLLLGLARDAAGKKDDAAFREIIQSAEVIARKYQVDMSHAEQTRSLAVQLFDQLAGEHRLGERHRLLLEVAAILHEVGTFVASRAHHKHSFYLIANSEIVGLTQDELAVVANVARYHRRSRPKPSHLDYIALPRERRMIVNKLAALLRVAEALDSSRTQQIGTLQSRIDGSGLIISVQAGADFTLERRALAETADMMLDIYGLEVRLERITR